MFDRDSVHGGICVRILEVLKNSEGKLYTFPDLIGKLKVGGEFVDAALKTLNKENFIIKRDHGFFLNIQHPDLSAIIVETPTAFDVKSSPSDASLSDTGVVKSPSKQTDESLTTQQVLDQIIKTTDPETKEAKPKAKIKHTTKKQGFAKKQQIIELVRTHRSRLTNKGIAEILGMDEKSVAYFTLELRKACILKLFGNKPYRHQFIDGAVIPQEILSAVESKPVELDLDVPISTSPVMDFGPEELDPEELDPTYKPVVEASTRYRFSISDSPELIKALAEELDDVHFAIISVNKDATKLDLDIVKGQDDCVTLFHTLQNDANFGGIVGFDRIGVTPKQIMTPLMGKRPE